MPLSEHEERVMAEIERHLAAEDPRFVARTQRRARSAGPNTVTPRRRLVAGIIGAVIGVVCVVLLTLHVAFGITGFLLLLVSLTLIVGAIRDQKVADVRVLETDSQTDSHHD